MYNDDQNDLEDDYWTYDGSKGNLIVYQQNPLPTSAAVNITVKGIKPLNELGQLQGFRRCNRRAELLKALYDNQWPDVYQEDYTILMETNELSESITADPINNIDNALRQFAHNLPLVVTEITGITAVNANVTQQALAFMSTC